MTICIISNHNHLILWHTSHLHEHITPKTFLFSERSRSLFAVARPYVICLSVTLVHPTQAVEIFGNISMALGTLAIR